MSTPNPERTCSRWTRARAATRGFLLLVGVAALKSDQAQTVERGADVEHVGSAASFGQSLTPEFSFSSRITTREWVDALPSDFVEVLGTDHVERDINS